MSAIRIFSGSRHVKNLLSLPQKSVQARQKSELIQKQTQKMKKMQAMMQCDDGKPVYLKKGTSDKVIFGLSVFSLILISIGNLRFIGRWAKKL